MREFKWPIIASAATGIIGGSISWLTSTPIWIGAIIGFAFPMVFFAGAMLAVLGMFQIAADYLKERSR